MPSLKEIKGRIGSVKSTLKITSAMKLVASAKLKRAQTAIGNMVPYQEKLTSILMDLMDTDSKEKGHKSSAKSKEDSIFIATRPVKRVALVCMSSNSSLCGGFNANSIRQSKEVITSYLDKGFRKEDLVIYAVGKRMATALSNAGYDIVSDFSDFSGSPDYEMAKKLAKCLVDGFVDGTFDQVELIYNHFASTGSQPTVHEVYLPLSVESIAHSEKGETFGIVHIPEEYILEPGRDELIDLLLPKVLKMKIYTVLLDAAAAEHAARTVAMQIATDNGNELLDDLTLQYNKGRQQKITSEILDIVGGTIA